MTCDQTQTCLEAFAGGELGWGMAWRIRRHLAGCAACAAQLAETRHLDSRVRAWRDVPTPAGLGDRIAAALPPPLPVSALPNRRVHVTRRAAVGLAGIAAAAAAFFWLLPGQPGRPTIAFADVEQAMQQVQTVSWVAEAEVYDKPDLKTGTLKVAVINWLRRDPPAVASTGADVTPSHNSNGVKTLNDARGQFFLTKDQCTVLPGPNDLIRQTVENQIRSFTRFPQAAPSSAFGRRVQTTPTNFRQISVVLNGQDQVRFDRDIKTVWIWKGRTDYQLSHVSTWADPETHRVTRNESHVSEDTRMGRSFKPYIVIEDQFRYDQTPPKGTFDWSPPVGMKVIRMLAEPTKK